MVNRIYIVTLIMLFFLSVGRASVRADILMVVNSVMLDSVIKPDEWREVYRWVLADKNVPDRKEVLMLIRFIVLSFSNPSFSEQLTIAAAVKATNKIFLITICF